MVDQTSQFYAILTTVGAAKQANADALGIPWKITHMAVGDGNPSAVENPPLPMPNAGARALLNEWRRAPLNQLKVDDKDSAIIVAEQVIPAEVGGRWIREIGLYDADGDMVAVANCAPTYKPLLNQGSGRTQVVRMNLVVSSASNVQLKIDPSVVLATREWVTEELAKQDFKHSVLVATTAAITLSGLQTVDGVVLTAGARVLVKNQAAAKDNGLYQVAAGGPWIRCADAGASDKVTPGLLVLVEKGTVNADSAWQLVADAPITLGVTALVFEMAFGRTGVAAGTYRSVTVDAYGRVVAASNPTTVAGYGLTDVFTKTQVDQALALKANLVSPALTGAPTAPTAAAGTNSTQLATTAFVRTALAALVDSSPAALDTLNELAAAIGNDPSFANSMTNLIAGKADKGATLASYGILDAIRLGQFGLGVTSASEMDDYKKVNPTGFYLCYGAANGATATLNAPPDSKTNVLATLAIAPRYDLTYYLAFENGPTSASRKFWLGQYNTTTDTLRWSSMMTSEDEATQLEAEAGLIQGKWMSPLRVFQALRSVAAKATESLLGVLRVGSVAEVNAGALDDVAVTPKKLRWGFSASLGANGYIVFPTWLGGLILQWGTAGTTNGFGTWTYPLVFPKNVFRVFASNDASASGSSMYACGAHPNAGYSSATIASQLATGGDAIYLFAIGY